MIKKPLVNRQIRASEVRLIDDTGKQLGLIPLEEALKLAEERGLDLIQVTEKVVPPVCKILDYGKYLYRLRKKEKKTVKSTEVKGIRLRFNISPHDLETRVSQAVKFLNKGNKVRVDMVLRGREKRLAMVAKEKVNQFLKGLEQKINIKVDGNLKRKPRGFSIMVSKKQEQPGSK